MYNKTQLCYPNDASIQHSMNNMSFNSFYQSDAYPNGSTLQNCNVYNKLFPEKNISEENCDIINGVHTYDGYNERANDVVSHRNKKKRSKIRMNCNYRANTNEESGSDNNGYHLSNKMINTSKKVKKKDTLISITTDDRSSESDYTECSEQSVPSLGRSKRPRKKFMGKYSFSEIKNSFLYPWNLSATVASQSNVLNPRLDCFHYRITTKTKGGERDRKPEILVRF
ncbi:hypothetical protein PGO_123650 [Plasmodium gonderi]|uniref:Uncharacterized protein n=1 Tax=Plasmodium gonderi TaxID=77519 RepID=A0A1Y1JMD6_PLAGO|nr:hypothetical protein PGO_123650 [Plasmodium gonderi]GAW82367.1 hypothetical protein PGO_123650 [Plasmodium gonderi]